MFEGQIRRIEWTESEHISMKNLQILLICLPGTNAAVEREFSIINEFWSNDKSKSVIQKLSAVAMIRINLNCECAEFLNILQENVIILKYIHSSLKYSYNQ